MASTFSTNLHLELQATGEDSGTWGANLNNNVFANIDNRLGSALSLPLSNTDVILNTAQTLNNWIVLTGTLTGNVNVIFPQIGGTWLFSNNTTGAFTVTIKTTAVSGGTTVLPQGVAQFVVLNGTDAANLQYARGATSSVSGNLPMFADATGKVLSDSGTQPPVIATQPQAEAGTSNVVYNTPLRTAQQTTARLASQAQAQAGTDNVNLMTALRTAQAIDVQASAFPSTSTSASTTDFPIGTCLTLSDSTSSRCASATLYLDAGDSRQYTNFNNGGAQLAGTWLQRGRGPGNATLYQRVA